MKYVILILDEDMVIIMKKEEIRKDSNIEVKSKPKKKKKLKQSDIKKYSSNQIDHVILKIKANERRYTIISVCIILFVFLICSYFVFSSIQKSFVKTTFKTGSLVYEFSDRETGIGDIIDLVDVKALSDIDGLKTETYKVTIFNDSDDTQIYEIFIIDDLEKIDYDGCSNIFTDRKYIKYSVNGNIPLFLGESDVAIITGELKAKTEIGYDINVFVGEDYSLMESPHYHGKIVVKQKNEEKE